MAAVPPDNDAANPVPIRQCLDPPGSMPLRNRFAHGPVGAATSRPQPRITGSTQLNGVTHCRGRLAVDPPASATEPSVERCQLPTWGVGADRIRPWHRAPLSGCSVPGRLLVDPYSGACHSSGYYRISGASGGCYPPLRLGGANRAGQGTNVLVQSRCGIKNQNRQCRNSALPALVWTKIFSF